MTKQPIYAVTDYDDCPYITAGKAYRVVEYDGGLITVVDDVGDTIDTLIEESGHFKAKAGWHLIRSLQDEQPAQDQELTPAQVIAAAPAKTEDEAVTPNDPLTRYRTAQRQAEERAAWDGYVAGILARVPDVMQVISTADALLELRRERFPT